jgi:hypothetical protein
VTNHTPIGGIEQEKCARFVEAQHLAATVQDSHANDWC